MKAARGLFTLEQNVLLTVPNAAAQLSISRSSMYRLIAEKKIPVVVVQGKIRIRVSALERFIDNLERERNSEVMFIG